MPRFLSLFLFILFFFLIPLVKSVAVSPSSMVIAYNESKYFYVMNTKNSSVNVTIVSPSEVEVVPTSISLEPFGKIEVRVKNTCRDTKIIALNVFEGNSSIIEGVQLKLELVNKDRSAVFSFDKKINPLYIFVPVILSLVIILFS